MARASIVIHNPDGPGTFKCTCGYDVFWRTGDGSPLLPAGYECQRCHAIWSEKKSTKPRPQPDSDAPPEVKAAKLELRRLGAEEREVRKRWTDARAGAMTTAASTGLRVDCYTASDLVAGHVGVVTIALWAAEQAREQAAARWRLILAQREAMPVADRWNLADLEAWASWSPGVL